MRAHPLDRVEREQVAVDPLGVVGIELLLDRRQRGGGSGHRDPLARAGRSPPSASSAKIRSRTSSASASSSPAAGGSLCQVALGVADDAGLKRGVEDDLAPRADDELGRAAADVDHQGAIDAAGRPADGAAVGEPRLLGAVEDPGVEREALAKLGDEGARVVGVAHGAGGDRGHHVGPQRLVDRDVLADRVADVLDRLGGELVRGVDAAAEPGHRRAALELGDVRRPRRRRRAAGWSWFRCRRPRRACVRRQP